jgi:dTMP kinase
MSARRGRFIAFEGGEGSGKSTQAALLADAIGALLTREPGGTAVGGRIRELVLSPSTGELDPRAEALLMAADRAQHVAEVVQPELASGRHVVTDRFAGSSIAYQGFGRGLPATEVEGLSRWATAGCWPDLVVLLDVPADVADGRLQRDLDRMEAAGAEFHQRVGDGFRTLAAGDPGLWAVVDGSASIDAVHAAVVAVVRERLQLLV